MRYMLINGELVPGSGSPLPVYNPATEDLEDTVATANLTDVQRALSAARAAFPGWASTPVMERQRWMQRLCEEVAAAEEDLRDDIHREMGKPWAQTQEDVDSLKKALSFYAEEIARVRDFGLVDRAGTHRHRMVHEPVGVVLAYIAWNFPLLNLAFKIGPALAAGCPIIVRPCEETPLSAYAVGALCQRIGLPPGVVQILCTESLDVADAMTASHIPAMVTLIGSTPTGCHIMRTGATTIKRYSMELGGNAPVLVFPDADLERAADIVCALKFTNAGQICVAPNRVFVARAVLDAFTERVIDRANHTRVGYDKTSDIQTGPLINRAAWARVKQLVDSAVADGAVLHTGGERPPGHTRGHFFAPTVLGHVTRDMAIYRKEIFGPVISIIPFENESPLLDYANEGDDGGLTAYIFTKDLDKAERFAAGLRYGEIQINGVKYDIDLPHGGIGQSGIGHDCSVLALNDYLVLKRISQVLDTTR